MTATSSSDRARFNLLELLLVIAAVAIITVFVLPMFMRHDHSEHRPRVRCAGNLKQIGLASLMYSGDYDGDFPQGGEYGSTNWEPLVSDGYLQNGKVWACPAGQKVFMTADNSDYKYIGSGLKDDNANATSVSMGYDESGNHPDNDWMNILFIDGHVEGAKPGTKRGKTQYNN